MIQRVYEQVSKAIEDVFIATDDHRIFEHVMDFGGQPVMTSYLHNSGTDRCNEALFFIEKEFNKQYEVVLNVQGDEPFIQVEPLSALIDCFEDSHVQIATLIKKTRDKDEIFNPNLPKVILSKKNEAIYFSRSTIPYVRSYPEEQWGKHHVFYKHIGIYAYQKKVLKEITHLQPSTLENAESLEQNRWLEHGYNIYTVQTDFESHGIDTPEDLEKAKKAGMF